MAFQVIHTAPNLAERERRRAHRSGPWAVSSRHAPDELMRRAGFVDIVILDQTAQFRSTANAWITEWDDHRDALVALHGEAEFETRQQERRMQLLAVDDGLLRRSLVTGRKVGVTSIPPARCISQPTQIRHTLISSWHSSEATIDSSRSSPQQ